VPIGCPPCRRIFYVQNEYIIISCCVFNLNFIALIVSEVRGGGSQIYIRGPCAPVRFLAEKIFISKNEYLSMYNCIFNFIFLVLIVSEIIWVSQIYIREPCAPGCPWPK